MDHTKTVQELINKHKYQKVVEIGAWKCELSEAILDCPSVKQLWLVDPYDIELGGFPTEPRWTQTTADNLFLYQQVKFRTDDTVNFVRKTSEQSSLWIPRTQLVFIDGLHDYENVKLDINIWRKKLTKGGMISGHDYHETAWPGVVKAVNEAFSDFSVKGTVWYRKL